MPKSDLYITSYCPACEGNSRAVPRPPKDYHSGEYAQWSQETHLAQPCQHCKGTGKIERINPAWLKEARISAGLSRRDMAARVNRSYFHVANVENGYAACTPAILVHYAELKPVAD